MSKRRQRSTRRTRSKAAPTSLQRHRLLRRRPSSDRMSGARPGGPCRSVGGQVPGARHVSPASQCEPAGVPLYSPFRGSKGARTSEASPRGMPSQGPGDLTWSRQTSTPVRRRREATEREELVTGESKEDGELRTAYPSAAPNSMPAVWRRGPRLVNVASGLAHRSAQHLTPLRGRPLRTEEAMEREGASSSALRTTL